MAEQTVEPLAQCLPLLVGSVSGPNLSLPSAVLRSSAIELTGSVAAGRLVRCIDPLLGA
jgi:hypothetical protein